MLHKPGMVAHSNKPSAEETKTSSRSEAQAYLDYLWPPSELQASLSAWAV